ncbi:MAG: metal-dependent hydrolase [Chloroflexi bacterium]|nr:metal-dependent hydrolase [Chloroflexota bacterium]
MNKSVRISISSLLALVSAVLVLLVGTLSSGEVARLPLGSLPVLLITIALVLAIIFFGNSRIKKWDPAASGWKGFIPAAPWGNLPFGILFGLVVGGLVSYFVPGTNPTDTGLGAALFPDEITGTIIGILLGVFFAILVDARLAAGFLLGYGLGFPTALIITNPNVHELRWSYGGHIVLFGSLALLHLLLKPLLDSAKNPDR